MDKHLISLEHAYMSIDIIVCTS